jgi:hypothetical protein
VTTPSPAQLAGPGTGLDEARQALEAVAERPVAEHVAVYDAVHRQLQAALAALDEG